MRSVSWSVVVAVLSSVGGCAGSSSSGGGGCGPYCAELCDALDACELGSKDCRQKCEASHGKSCSGAEAPDRLTCAEAAETAACAEYCSELCGRASSCGSFDAEACARGCEELGPPVCNPASVAARTCDQIKPEIERYESVGRAGTDGLPSAGFGPRYGLCMSGSDCEAPLGCSGATNTCATCASDADCARERGAFICSGDHECVEVDCVTDKDCLGQVCDENTHECHECRTDAQCRDPFPACDPEKLSCVKCTTDAQCEGDPAGPRCDLERHQCAHCAKNADCPAGAPVCTLGYCGACFTDSNCAGRDSPICSGGACVAR